MKMTPSAQHKLSILYVPIWYPRFIFFSVIRGWSVTVLRRSRLWQIPDVMLTCVFWHGYIRICVVVYSVESLCQLCEAKVQEYCFKGLFYQISHYESGIDCRSVPFKPLFSLQMAIVKFISPNSFKNVLVGLFRDSWQGPPVRLLKLGIVTLLFHSPLMSSFGIVEFQRHFFQFCLCPMHILIICAVV